MNKRTVHPSTPPTAHTHLTPFYHQLTPDVPFKLLARLFRRRASPTRSPAWSAADKDRFFEGGGAVTDDFVICTHNPEESCWLLQAIRNRCTHCGLTVSEEKTRLLSFGRTAWAQWRAGGAKPERFDFPGFTRFVGTSRKGTYKIGQVTSRKKFRHSLKALNVRLQGVRSLPIRTWWPQVAAKLRGHFRYYGVSGNFLAIARYYRGVLRLVKRALARRSQRPTPHLWDWLNRDLSRYPLPRPRIMHRWYDPLPVR